MAPRRGTAGLAVMALVAGLFGAAAAVTLDEPAPAAAATSSSQAWVTSVSGVTGAGVGATRTLTFDSGITATETTTAVTGSCAPFGTGGAISGGTNVAAFIEPDPSAAVRAANINCQGPVAGGGSRTATVQLSKPVIAPVIHVVNLDASRAGVTGAGITLTQLAKNNALEVQGSTLNSTLQQALQDGCAANDGSNPNGACGSFRLTSTSPVTSFNLANNTAGSTLPASGNNDSWSYTLSYPTAPLTKAFNPTTITAGATSQLTFRIANPANPTQPTLTPLDFTDQLPAGVTLAAGGATATTGCGSPAVGAAAGGTSVTASGISVAAGATCEITVNVTSDTPASYTNDNDNLSTSVANLIPNADTTLTVTEVPVAPVPFVCGAGAPGTLFQQRPTDVYSVDLITGSSSQVGSDVFAGNLNAVGYNPADDFMYAFDQVASFYRIGSNWSPTAIGMPSNWDTVPAGIRTGLNVGEFDADGHYWVTNSNNTSPYGWAEIDLSDPASPTYMQVVSKGTFTMPSTWVLGADWGYNVKDGDLYATAYVSGSSPAVMGLVRFDTDSHTVSLVKNVGPLQEPDGEFANALFGAVYTDPDGFLYASNNITGGIWRFEMATGDAVYFAEGPASGLNDGARCFNSPLPIDFGDAPGSFGTTLATDGARHMIVEDVHLGASIDAEADGQPNAAADGDGGDEDGVTFNPALGYSTPTIRTGLDPQSQQPIQNTLEIEASADGFVSVWVDWNQDGDFLDAGEQVANAQAVTAGSNDVTFAQGTNPAGIQSYVRVRYATDAASIGSPVGAASNGEVEDYRVLFERLVQPDTCTVSGAEYYAFTFAQPPASDLTGTGGVGSTARYRNVTVVGGVAVDMFVEVLAGDMRETGSGGAPPNGFWTFPPDDAAWQIDPAATLRYSFYQTGTTTPVPINAVFTIDDLDSPETATFKAADLAGYAVTQGSTVVVSESGGDVVFDGTSDGNATIQQRFQVVFEGVSSFDAEWEGFRGSGFGFDGDGDNGIQPPACQDFGDAPDSYGTTAGANGANHTIVPGLTIGTDIDFDPDGQPSADATGDDDDRLADEDGVADEIVVVVGDQTTVTVTATNSTASDATLAGWIDLDGSGTFDAGELVTVTVPAGSGTADYSLVFPAGTTTSGTFARFRLFPAGDAIAPTGPATAGEVEDHAVTVTERDLAIEKTSDATADSRPGDVVTYTVTATNTGTADYTAANPAVVLDDISGVLDDGTYNNDAQASDGPAPAYASPLISWSGPLAAGDSVTIEYTVTLAGGGDGVVRNVAFGPGCVPGAPGCDTTTPVCDPPAGGVDPATGIPCAETELLLPKLTHTKVANTTELPADGGEVEYTITVRNEGPGVFTSAAPGSMTDDLSRVLDDATITDGPTADVGTATFDPASESIEWTGPLGVGDVATITYTVTYDSAAGDNVLLNVACLPAELAQDPTDRCRSVQIPGSALQDRKSVSPASGTSVVAGQQVTYTLHFDNTGQADAAVDTFDDLSDVLDDATLTAGPTASNPALTAVLNGTRLDIDGTVPAGQTYTVTYTVTVNAFDQQGDHILANVLGGDEGCLEGDPTCRTENPIRHLSVTKTSDAAADVKTGDVVTYTVTVHNDGEGDYTDQQPAVARDDLSGVIDDATYNDDATASAGAVSYASPLLTWTGALAAGDTETFSYTVTVTNAGDHVLENTAGPVCATGEICDPPVVVTTPLPHVVPAKSSDPATGAALSAGDVVTYTLSWTNDGEAPGVISDTDDLSDVLDDADVTGEPVASDPAVTAVRNGDEIRVTGPIQVDQTITVTYQVTVKPDGQRGNDIAENVLTPDVPPHVCEDGDTDCDPFVPPTTEHPIGELDDWKTVDPASGSTVQPGQHVTYTLHFENTGEADVAVDRDDVLTRVLDDATITTAPASSDPALSVSPVNGDRFTVSGVLVPGQRVTVQYTVTVNPDGQRGDDRLGNALVPGGTDPAEECVPVDPERPDCTVNHVSNVIASKSANPASGTKVSPGQQVTYTLTFENVSTNPNAAPARIDYTDHMADVLDDATLTTAPVSSDADVAAVRSGDSIRITGVVAPGDTVTVTYAVTVKAYDQQADHQLGNVVAVTGEEPICAPGSTLCTSHGLVSTPPPLAVTGGGIAWGLAGLAGILLIGGAVLAVKRRREQHAVLED